MATGAVGRQLLSQAYQDRDSTSNVGALNFQNSMTTTKLPAERFAKADLQTSAILHEQANMQHDRYVRLLSNDERVQRTNMLGGFGMQQSLSHCYYKPTAADSLSVEMARQKDLQRSIKDENVLKVLPAGALSGMHLEQFEQKLAIQGPNRHHSELLNTNGKSASNMTAKNVLGAGYQNRANGVVNKPSIETRNPILATGDLQITRGFDIGTRSLKRRSNQNNRRNIITGEGKYKTYGFDAYSRPMFGTTTQRNYSQISLSTN